MNEMTKRQRIMAAIQSEATDRLPWAPLIDDYFISSLRTKENPNAEIISVMRELDVDILERHVDCVNETMRNVEVREWKNDAGTESFQELITRVGTLRSSSKFIGKSWVMSEHPIKDETDLKTFRFIAENTDYSPNYEAFLERDAYIGDDGVASASGIMSPLQELLQFQIGVENTVYFLADYPEEMAELMAVMQQRNLRQYAVIADSPAKIVIDYEDTSTTVMNPSMFTEYSLLQFNEYADVMKNAGKIFITHMCGSLNGLKAQIGSGRQCGVDSVCPPDTGDLTVWNARAAWGEKIIIGGICPPDLVIRNAEENLYTVCEIIKKMPTLKGYILSTGDATPYGTPVPTLKAITSLIKNLGPASLTGDFDTQTEVMRVINSMK